MGQIKWRRKAIKDIERFYTFLSEKDLRAAKQSSLIIIEGAKRLETSPRIGRSMADDTERRELVIQFGSGAYVIRYFLEKNKDIVITRIWHNRENR